MNILGEASSTTILILSEKTIANHYCSINYSLYDIEKQNVGQVFLSGVIKMDRYSKYKERITIRPRQPSYSLAKGIRENIIYNEQENIGGRPVWKLIKALINSNLYISFAAVFLTIETQIGLGMKPQWHPYLFIIFFATLFEYNLHRFITVITNKEALNSEKHKWVRDNLNGFYLLVFTSLAGFICVALLAKKEVLITLVPIALLTLFYSMPVFWNKKGIFKLREIPYLKIFLIAFVWASSTILLPIIQSNTMFNKVHVITMLAERSFFIFAITIPFDIRDIEVDKQAGLKTIPILFNENTSNAIANLSLFIFFLISFVHYQLQNHWFIIEALSISTLTTFLFLNENKFRKLTYFHYGILDGTMLLQGLLVLVFYYLK